MITLPDTMTATKYPGYFWDVNERQLYSIKQDGVLKPLPLVEPNQYNGLNCCGYRVSVKGKRQFLSVWYLNDLELTDSEITVIP